MWRLATQVGDLLDALNEVKPAVVHFSGHGGQAGLMFENADGKAKHFSNAELAMLLNSVSDNIRLAVFNTCESAEQAALACAYIDAAIGMEESVEDEAAITFAGQLYSSLGYGLPLEQAFEQARVQVRLTSTGVSGDPRLHTAAHVVATEMFLVAPPTAEAA